MQLGADQSGWPAWQGLRVGDIEDRAQTILL